MNSILCEYAGKTAFWGLNLEENTEMNISNKAVKRPVATAAILFLILIIGLVSLYQSPLDLLPDIEAPVLAVITSFPGSSPQESLELVTKPIEDSVSAVGGVTGIRSFSQENLSLVIVIFDWGADVKDLRENVRMRIDLVSLPDGANRPMILEFDPTLMPIMQVSASGADDLARLTGWLKDTASPRLESVRGVAEVQVMGGVEEDIFVRATPDAMAEYEVSFQQVANVLRASLMDLPAGIIELEDNQVRLRFLGRYAEIDLLSELIVGFKIDQEELEKMIGDEIDIDLNRLLADQAGQFSGGSAGGLEGMPVRELYWDDIFDFGAATIVNSRIILPVKQDPAFRNDIDIERSMRIFTVNPAITYEPEGSYLALSLSSLGLTRVTGGETLNDITVSDKVRLQDVWLIEHAVWDNDRVIVPLNPIRLDSYDVTAGDLNSLVDSHPLITGAGTNYILVSFHENWAEIRREPIISLPDLETWLSNVEREFSRSLDQASRGLENLLTELMVTSMVGNSMSAGGMGGNPLAGMDLDDDFPIIPVSLGMIAEVEQDAYEPSTITRYNRQPSISLVIQKEGDANTVTVARQVRQVLDQLSDESIGEFSQIEFDTVLDQAEEIERALADLAWSLLGGAALAIIVLILFLKNWRTTMFIALSIPTAIIATFTLLYFADLTINLMTLGGLALAAGMLVDNAIVVSENIYRHYQLGENPADAAVKGAREVAGAITASTLTTISVFFPVIFLSGLAGQLFWEFALTVGCAILASLFVALTVIPLLASRSLHRRRDLEANGSKPPSLPNYRRALKLAVNHPWWVIIFAALFVAGGALGFTTLGTELFPSPDESSFSININLPPGSTLDKTDSFVSELELILADKEEVVAISTRVGGSQFMGMPGGGGSSNEARVRVEIDPAFMGEIDRIIEETRVQTDALPYEAETSFNRESVLDAAGLETSLDLVISGGDLDTVMKITEQAVEILADHPTFSDVQSSLEENRPEVHVRLDHSEALKRGVTLAQVAGAVREALEGLPVSRLETETGILQIILGYEKQELKTVEDLGSVGFYTAGGQYVRIDEVATLEEAFGPRSIPREDREIVGQVEAQYGNIDLGTARSEAFEALQVIDLPPGYEIKTAGSAVLMDDVLEELELVLIVAALLVYLVMAAQFESLLHPFIIICTLPLAYAGSIIALMITGNSISVPALIGLIVLSGILVNDGIIMVDYINQQRRLHGLKLSEAIIEGAAARLRPILMTTATTALGLLPLAMGFGEGAQLQAPMAIAIIGGQFTGTILLLLAVPSIYRVVTRETGSQQEFSDSRANSGSLSPAENKIKPTTTSGSEYNNGRPGERRLVQKDKPLFMIVVRMVVVLILMVLILILFNLSGQEPFMLIR